MLNVVTWWWGTKYSDEYVRRLAFGVHRHLKQPHRFVVMQDNGPSAVIPQPAEFKVEHFLMQAKERKLLAIKGCFARLRMFDPEWQEHWKLKDRIVCLDLDTVITGQIDPLFDRGEPFVILNGANASNPCPYTACIFMLRAGAHPELWTEFSLEAAQRIPKYEFADDQGWMHFKVPDAAVWKVGHESGIYAFKKPGWPSGEQLPGDAKIVAFPGHRDPAHFEYLPWVRKHWIGHD